MNVERLELLKEAIREQQKKDLFDLSSWAYLDKEYFSSDHVTLRECEGEIKNNLDEQMRTNKEDRCFLIDPQHFSQCCSAACALGSAAVYQPLFDQGLRLIANVRNGNAGDIIYFDGRIDFDAGAKFFGISLDDSDYLFEPGEYDCMNITGDMVIDRIDELIAKDKKNQDA